MKKKSVKVLSATLAVCLGLSTPANCLASQVITAPLSLREEMKTVKLVGAEQKTMEDENSTDSETVKKDEVMAVSGGAITIASADMTVTIDPEFPRVEKYEINGKTFYGQKEMLNKITVNGIDMVPKVTVVGDETSRTYTMTVQDEQVHAVITSKLSVDKNIVTFEILNVETKDNTIVKTIEIKNHNLVSVNSEEVGANLQGTHTLSTNTHRTGDHGFKVDGDLKVADEAKRGYLYAFVSNSDFSAGLWSNSENNVTSDWQRVTATATQGTDGVKTVGLSSTYWTWQKGAGYRVEDGSMEYKDGTTKLPVSDTEELPCTKVIITSDRNDDATVDWQDGAIAYREIMNNPLGAEMVPDLAAYRIAMNFGSQAQNPFLMSLDNVKKVYLNTDGLGQSVLLKGYGSEGHDSGHLDYADIGRRIGGADEMKTLLKKGAELGATFGIHVNASETYPESKYFSPEILRKNADGTYNYGWNWIDQGININADYDLRNGRVDRWGDLYKALGGAENDLDFIYVDVWGNGQSGDNGTWASRQLSKEITGHGWRVTGEWGHANEYDSTFQHWAADLGYGGYLNKGINSTIARFIRNHQKDSWVGNRTSYGGRADAPLLGGMDMTDFEGWQGRSDYAAYMNKLFEVNIPSKLIQHFEVTNWVDGTPVEMSDNGETYSWTPGMKATLKDTTDEANPHELVVERMSNDYTKDTDRYRSRTMTYDGKVVYTGQAGNVEYLIPWSWDAQGQSLSNPKMYHWNTKGGESTWAVPEGWNGKVEMYELNELGKQNKVEVEITDGKLTLNAKAGVAYVIYQNGKPATPKAITWSDGMHIEDSGFNGGTLKPWILGGETTVASIAKSNGSNPMLKFTTNQQKVTATQELTDLKPNTKYAAYVGIDNRSEAMAGIEVKANGKTSSNQSGLSIAKNYIKAYAHNTNKAVTTVDGSSYFQNLYVFFETGSDGKATLTLSRDAGSGDSYFDDVRICENDSQNWGKWDTEGVFTQDFEKVAQGVYPFVLGNLEGVEDNRTHLSQFHAPYTQRGWNGKVVNDVIDGEWSIKTNGLSRKKNMVYQTIPQNFKFEPGQSYMIEFDYESGGEGTYSFVTGDGKYEEAGTLTNDPLACTANSTIVGGKLHKTFTYNLVGSESGLNWIGIYSNNISADTQGVTIGAQINFNGYNDFMLDNLKITKVTTERTELWKAIKESKGKEPAYYTKDSFANYETAYAAAVSVHDIVEASQKEIDDAKNNLLRAVKDLTELKITKDILKDMIATCDAYKEAEYSTDGWLAFVVTLNYAKSAVNAKEASEQLLKKAYVDLVQAKKVLEKDKGAAESINETFISASNFKVEAGSAQPGTGAEGPATNAVDNNPSTIWHSSWAGETQDKLWFEFALNEPETVDGLHYLRRKGGGNGQISKYEIMISKDNKKSFTKVAEGIWKKEDGWQEVSFAPQENVTHVRVNAVETQNAFAAAAELRITGPVKETQEAPTGLSSQSSQKGSESGVINGVNNKMEYSNALFGNYTKCKETLITGLKADDYFVRMAGTATQKASIPVKITVFEVSAGGGYVGPGIDKPETKPEEPKVAEKSEEVTTEISSKPLEGTLKSDGFFYAADGKKLTETIVKTGTGETYIVDKDGKKYISSIVTSKGNTKYITGDNGVIVTGEIVKTNGKSYYTTKGSGKVVVDKLIKVKGNKYIATESGALSTGKIVTVKGSEYYTTKATGKVVMNKLFKLNGNQYFADKSGKIATSKWVTIDGEKCYFNKDGMLTKKK